MEGGTHARTARAFLEAASRELDDGDELQASEKMWGAASHAVRAVIRARGWPNGKTKDLDNAVSYLADEYGKPHLNNEFSYFRNALHSNFYHGFLEIPDLENALPRVRMFVDEVLPAGPRLGIDQEPPAHGK